MPTLYMEQLNSIIIAQITHIYAPALLVKMDWRKLLNMFIRCRHKQTDCLVTIFMPGHAELNLTDHT